MPGLERNPGRSDVRHFTPQSPTLLQMLARVSFIPSLSSPNVLDTGTSPTHKEQRWIVKYLFSSTNYGPKRLFGLQWGVVGQKRGAVPWDCP